MIDLGYIGLGLLIKNKMTFRIILLSFTLVFSLLVSVSSWSRTAKSIIDEAEKLYQGNSSRSTITMKIVTDDYERSLSLEAITDGDDLAHFRILSPKKDRGIATLMRFKEMWNFLPKIDRVIKVPPSMMMSSWMGSDFTNDDLVKQTELVEEYDLSLSDKGEFYIITLTPKSMTVTVWGKIEYHILKDPLIPIRQIFYDEKEIAIRQLEFLEPKIFDKQLLPSKLIMTPLNKKGHQTIIIYDSIIFDPEDISEDMFTLRYLKRRF